MKSDNKSVMAKKQIELEHLSDEERAQLRRALNAEKTIGIRCRTDEEKRWRAAAEKDGLTLSAWGREHLNAAVKK